MKKINQNIKTNIRKDALTKKNSRSKMGTALNWFRYNLALAIPAIAVIVVFGWLHPQFLTLNNMTNILREMTVIAILATGLTIVMATGKFDMSFYGIGNFVVMTCAVLTFYYKLPIFPMVLVGIFIGLAIGSLSGVLVSVLHFPDIIATIGIAGAFSGLAYAYTGGTQLWMYAFPNVLKLGTGSIGFLSIPVIILIVVIIIAYIFMYKLKWGLRVESVGTSPDTVIHSGVSVVKYRFLAFIIAGALSGLAGVIFLGRYGKGVPFGFDVLMLPVVATTFMGTAMFKGKANIIGTLIGVFIWVSVANGLTLLNVHWEQADLYRPVLFLRALIAAIYIRKKRIVG